MKTIAIIVAVLGIMYVGYYFISPLFITITVDEGDPRLDAAETIPQVANKPVSTVSATPAVDTSRKPIPTTIPEPTVPAVAKPSIRAAVVGTPGHSAQGTAELITVPSGTVVRYENFQTTNGPDLFVYLATDLRATEFVNLGELKATEGNVNYPVPDTVDVSKYPYVLVWCKQFSVLFNSAKIQ